MSGKEIRLHGRGGQGAVLAAKMLASAFAVEGKSVASFPMYGFERRGMPVIAFTRFDVKPIMEKTQIYTPPGPFRTDRARTSKKSVSSMPPKSLCARSERIFPIPV
jgi:2-oxoacid:acceptor oxidoreductase gamma subunit (pyruvate/2-ketoisovalerate family)